MTVTLASLWYYLRFLGPDTRNAEYGPLPGIRRWTTMRPFYRWCWIALAAFVVIETICVTLIVG